MSVAGLLNMTCTINRRTATTNDSGEDTGTYAALATSVPCRLSQGEGQELYNPSVSTVYKSKLFFDYGQDITEDDQIASIANEGGTTLVSSALVERVNHDPGGERSHVEVWLREVRA